MQKILTHQAAGKGQKVPVDTQVKLKLLDAKLDKKLAKLHLKQS